MAVMCSVAAILLGCHVYLLRMVWLFAHVRTTEADLAVAWAFCRTPYMSIWSRAWDCSLQLWYRGSCKVWSSPKSRQILHNSKNRHWAESWRWSLKAQHPASTLTPPWKSRCQNVRPRRPIWISNSFWHYSETWYLVQKIWFLSRWGTYGGQAGKEAVCAEEGISTTDIVGRLLLLTQVGSSDSTRVPPSWNWMVWPQSVISWALNIHNII